MDDFMKCRQCLEDNRESIAKHGYGYGYIGNQHDCYRHNRHNTAKVDNPVKWANNKWTYGEPCQKTPVRKMT